MPHTQTYVYATAAASAVMEDIKKGGPNVKEALGSENPVGVILEGAFATLPPPHFPPLALLFPFPFPPPSCRLPYSLQCSLPNLNTFELQVRRSSNTGRSACGAVNSAQSITISLVEAEVGVGGVGEEGGVGGGEEDGG